jgi:hypothetical protein
MFHFVGFEHHFLLPFTGTLRASLFYLHLIGLHLKYRQKKPLSTGGGEQMK